MDLNLVTVFSGDNGSTVLSHHGSTPNINCTIFFSHELLNSPLWIFWKENFPFFDDLSSTTNSHDVVHPKEINYRYHRQYHSVHGQ
ncbi:hypothetical protein RIR_jg792.t1 [Rhizophagus irregularis DAOM 181602=DAOM 197198]|uniref:Uncharacterized protein n=1 Tax=Rhizophagus irregularis (strain DAOM 181602 / DAOM 197198 / MUCL 43194) TaxID=747089 RepID=U9TM41_RHIID|nr:hypothetical protein RIR_jg792.t1 [Rhizophagus irregularis DAOM 181602=DAOM 197198]